MCERRSLICVVRTAPHSLAHHYFDVRYFFYFDYSDFILICYRIRRKQSIRIRSTETIPVRCLVLTVLTAQQMPTH